MNILITGGCGYTGTVLTQSLLQKGYNVRVMDTQWFGNHLENHKNLKIIKEDVRNIKPGHLKNIQTVVHLANIANDPSVELNPNLSWEVNVLATKKVVEMSISQGVKNFIFASSGSVYGIKKEKKVTENLSLLPITTYNKTKMIAERVLVSYSKKIKVHCIRPATVCGYSPRMRLDVSVNMFVYQALTKKKLTVFGGQQIRPNIHIKDLINVYLHFIKKPNTKSGFYNAGFENLKIIDIAKLVSKHIPSKITILKDNNDPRSYRQDSEKLIKTGFKNRFSVTDAIIEIKKKFETGQILIDEKCNTVKWMKKLKIK
jgi:nucleoside-diphosphate-sugar epimerase